MSKPQYHYHSRKFLNKTNGLAAIEATVDITGHYKDVTVTISDCSRMVSLDFGFRDRKGKREMQAKLNNLISELVVLSNAIDEVDV